MIFGDSLGIHSPKNDPRSGSGIYFLWRREKLVYVGQALCVFARAAMHCKDKHFDRSTFLLFRPSDLDFVESYLIWFLMPELNKQIPLLGRRSQFKAGPISKRARAHVLNVLLSLPHDFVLRRFGEAEPRDGAVRCMEIRRKRRAKVNAQMLALFVEMSGTLTATEAARG